MGVELGFAVKDALVDALGAAVAGAPDGDALAGVEVHETWPERGIQGRRSVLVLDFTFDEAPATLRAGGGTRDARVRLDLAVAVWGFEREARAVRAQTGPIAAAVMALVRAQGAAAPGGAFGVGGVRQPEVRSGRVAEYVLDKGRRECDVHLVVTFVARYLATPAP